MNYDWMNSNGVRVSVYILLAFLTAISTDVNAGKFTSATMLAGITAAGIAYKAFRSLPKPPGTTDESSSSPPNIGP